MIKIIYIILFPFLILGCKQTQVEDELLSLKINNFNMSMYSTNGDKLYIINSPVSSFNKITQIIELGVTNINLFEDNSLVYKLNSDKSKLINNNKIIELQGNINMIDISKENNKLIADKFYWDIKNSEYILTGNVKLENKKLILNSSKALLNKDTNIIEFFNPVKYIIKSKSNNFNTYQIESENAYYNIETKSVKFQSKKDRVRSELNF